MIPLHEPFVGKEEAMAAAKCVMSGWVSSAGPQVTKFEQEFSEIVGRPAAAVSSGTAALHLALMLAGVGPGDKVLVPAMTFAATANAVVYCGAKPVFIDIRCSGNVGTKELNDWLVNNDTKNVKAAIVTHLFGLAWVPSSMRTLLNAWGIILIEDAAQAVGRKFDGIPVGVFGKFGCFSFNGNKVVTCGGGGILVGDQEYIDRAKYLSSQAVDDPVCFDHGAVGFNYRMTAVAAAIGSVQLAKLDRITELKGLVYGRYEDAFGAVLSAWEPNCASTVPWLYAIWVPDAEYVVMELRKAGVGARMTWMPLPMTKAYKQSSADCPVAADLYKHLVCLPSSPGLSESNQDKVIRGVLEAVQ